MRRTAQLAFLLLVGLAGLAWATATAVRAAAWEWFERDFSARANLALTSARPSLVQAWDAPEPALQSQMAEIARDERVMAVAVCNQDLSSRATSQSYPEEFGCWDVGRRIRTNTLRSANGVSTPNWNTVAALPTGRIFVSAMPISAGVGDLGFIILIQDLSHLDLLEAQAEKVLMILFLVLFALSLALPLLAKRWARYGWSHDLRLAIRGEASKSSEFHPILSDVRELMARMAKESDDSTTQWNAERLKQTLNRHLRGERIVIVSNREPYLHQRLADGRIEVQHPASGLVTALEPVMRACSGVWVAHGAGGADRDFVDKNDRVSVPPGEESFQIRRVWLTEAEEQGYYYNFSNGGLWPLCHVAHARPEFRSEDWTEYRAVNQKFADAVCEEVDGDAPIILVQDYHFALAPAMIRRRLPAATVIMFWHIPWPNAERFGICPWRNELIEGLLGSSIVGFHTRLHCNNFLDAVDRYLESRIDRENSAVVRGGRRTLIRPYPISIEWPVRWVEASDEAAECRRRIWSELGLAPDALLGVGVDRLDYTKGIEERMLAVEKLLERHPRFLGRLSFVQLAAPSRTKIDRYRELNQVVEDLAERINSRFGTDRYRPIILLRSHHEPPEVFRYYRAADFCYVSSLHDGMNLVAKEFVAARTDLRGVLILSEFTGAAQELTEALIVNPYDLEAASDAMAMALTMPVQQQQDRIRSMRSVLAHFNVYRWAGKMLVDAARLRDQERVAGQYTERRGGGRP